MSSVVISGDTSGSVTLSAPAIAGSSVQTLVSTSGTLAPIVSGTAVASTSGTSIDFTSIPSWVKRITIMFYGVSTSGTSTVIVQIGSTTFTTTGYLGSVSQPQNAGATATTTYSSGFMIDGTTNAACVRYGSISIINISGNVWVEDGIIGRTDTLATSFGGGGVTLSGVLDRVRITTTNGTDTFDAGTVNIMYE